MSGGLSAHCEVSLMTACAIWHALASAAVDMRSMRSVVRPRRVAALTASILNLKGSRVGMSSPATEDAPQAPSTAAKPPRIGRGAPRWTPPKRRAVTKAQDAEPFTRREVRGGRDVVQERRRNDDNIPGLVNFASDPRTFAAGGAVVALSFVLYAYAFLSGGINDGTARYAGDPETMGSGFDFFASEPDDRPGERVWI